MKIAVIGTRGIPGIQGGIEKHCESLYPRLQKLGCDITVYARRPYRRNNPVGEFCGVKVVDLWAPASKNLETIVHTFVSVLKARKAKPDIVHLHGIGPSLVLPLCKMLGLRVVLTHHGHDYLRSKWGITARAALRVGEWLGVTMSDEVITISRGIQVNLRERFGKKSTLIPNGVELPSDSPALDEENRWGIAPGKYVFTATRIVPEKGLTDLINAYRLIRNPPFQLVIAGGADHGSPYSRKLSQMASSTNGVVLTGVLSGDVLRSFYANAGLFVLASLHEGLPISLLEAMSFGLPLLLSDIPPHREIPIKGARYFNAGDVDELSSSLTAALEQGIDDNEKEQNRALLMEEYSWDVIASRTLDVYRSLLE